MPEIVEKMIAKMRPSLPIESSDMCSEGFAVEHTICSLIHLFNRPNASQDSCPSKGTLPDQDVAASASPTMPTLN